jgi:hypothetical protein
VNRCVYSRVEFGSRLTASSHCVIEKPSSRTPPCIPKRAERAGTPSGPANYFLSTRWVFSSRRVKDRRLEFALFASVGLAGLCLNELILWSLHHRLGLHYLLARLVSAGLVLGWNFSVRRLTLFRA